MIGAVSLFFPPFNLYA